ncbi:MAG: hypothetical protein Q8R76_06250 [Candidatus Omnitrophota bacterium]|nr:hypothetical protein [Candidatus Omnitrophota bacterium]
MGENVSKAEGFGEIPPAAVDLAQKHVSDILALAVEYSALHQKALVVYDRRCDLARALTEAYRRCLPKAKFVVFDEVTPELVRADFANLQPSDLVVLIQSSNFRLNKFRIRVDLFNRSIKVIEHPHLSRMPGAEQLYYIDALAYDPEYYRGVGRALKERIDQARRGVLDSGGEQLVFSAGFEPAKLNVGDYTGMKNIGGQFPIGEVFTESKDLEAVNGRVRVFAFGDTTFGVNKPEEPITLVVNRGRVTETIDATPEFEAVLANIRKDEGGEVWVRELGFGLNRALTQERMVSDIGTYERLRGVHLSLGTKHNAYKKPNFESSRQRASHHVDIFANTQAVLLDGGNVFHENAWLI